MKNRTFKSESGIPNLSIVVPFYNEEKTLQSFFSTIRRVLDATSKSWEVICVNDGSKDNSLKGLVGMHHEDDRIKVVNLSRNFGQEAAITAGIDLACGEVVIPIDSDLQDPPELIMEFIQEWEKGFDVVLATRKTRSGDGLAKRVTAFLFYKVFNHYSRTPIPEQTSYFRLMDRKVVEAFKLMPERTRFLRGVFAWVGFPTVHVYFDRPGRATGDTGWSYSRMFGTAMDGLFSFSTIPLKISTYMGIFISLCSFLYAVNIVAKKMMYDMPVKGYASLMTVMLFIGGIQLMSLGVIGEYISRIFKETKRRPIYLVNEKIGFE